MANNDYQRRGDLPDNFMEKLSCYRNIVEISKQPDSEIDLQLRGGYINIYYKGGNLLRLSGQKSIFFSEKYFLTPKDNMCSSDVEKLRKPNYLDVLALKPSKAYGKSTTEDKHKIACTIYERIVSERNILVNKLKEAQTEDEVKSILCEMKKQMDSWKGHKVKDERSVQHYISLNNKSFDNGTDYLVLDIECAVSSKTPYIKDGESGRTQPRADILAIDRKGQLYVMELKYGKKSVNSPKAGVINHVDDFNKTMGHDEKWQEFVNNVCGLLRDKQEWGLIDKNVELKKEKPKFAFIFKETKTNERCDFLENLKKHNIDNIPTLYLPADSSSDEFPDENYKLREDRLCK